MVRVQRHLGARLTGGHREQLDIGALGKLVFLEEALNGVHIESLNLLGWILTGSADQEGLLVPFKESLGEAGTQGGEPLLFGHRKVGAQGAEQGYVEVLLV